VLTKWIPLQQRYNVILIYTCEIKLRKQFRDPIVRYKNTRRIFGINKVDASHECFVNGKHEEQLILSEDVGEFYRDKVNFVNATGHACFDSHRLIEQSSIAETK